MINGAHVIIYSTDADADRAFLRDVLKLSHVDVGEGWLIFAAPALRACRAPLGRKRPPRSLSDVRVD